MEVGVKISSKKKLVRSTWVCHVEKVADDKLAKRADARKWRGLTTRKTVIGDCINMTKKEWEKNGNNYS